VTLEVFIVRPPAVSQVTSASRQQVDGATYYGYNRLADTLNTVPGVRAALVDEAPAGAASVVFDQSADRLARSPGRGLLLEAERNGFLPIVQHDLLGALTADGLTRWRAGAVVPDAETLVGRRDVAERLGAVGGRVLGLRDLCYVSRPDWTSLPAALAAYLVAVLEARSGEVQPVDGDHLAGPGGDQRGEG
jgi:hypothetical protein